MARLITEIYTSLHQEEGRLYQNEKSTVFPHSSSLFFMAYLWKINISIVILSFEFCHLTKLEIYSLAQR